MRRLGSWLLLLAGLIFAFGIFAACGGPTEPSVPTATLCRRDRADTTAVIDSGTVEILTRCP